jgi:hypothetical protein
MSSFQDTKAQAELEQQRRERERRHEAKERARKGELDALFSRAAANIDKPGPVRFGDPIEEEKPPRKRYHRFLRRQ